jgi:DNA polymerase-3 subunit delta'
MSTLPVSEKRAVSDGQLATADLRDARSQLPTAILPPFDELVSQPYAARFLSTAIATGQTNHAYLFVGPLGAGKTEAARLLAEALLCGCDTGERHDDCLRVRHGTHPDLHVVNPLGASGYLIEQIAEIIHDAALAPVRADCKLYLITRADLLNGTTANALLKTLEEPPASATFVLLARTREAVLPTILSRCQAIAFRRVPEAEAEKIVCARSEERAGNARIALAVTGGSVYRAMEFIRSPERRAARLEVLGVLEQLDSADDLELLEAVKQLLVVLKAPLGAVLAEQELQLGRGRDYLSKGAQTRLEQQHKRELTNRERETVGEALDVIRSWLRDALMLRSGYAVAASESAAAADDRQERASTHAGEGREDAPAPSPKVAIVNYDHHYHIARIVQRVAEPQILAALAAVDAAQEQIQYNVSAQLALEGMFFRIREALGAGLSIGIRESRTI